MAISKNPTKTLTIESNWNREINIRWRAFKKSTVERLREMNQAAIVNRSGPAFQLSPAAQRAYMAFLQAEIDRLLLETPQAPNWQAKYQIQAYEKGIDNVRRSLRAQGQVLEVTAQELAAATPITSFTATSSLGATANFAPIHRDSIEFLYTRSYESLKGWTDQMARQTRQILTDGVSQGKGINDVVREMVARQDVSRSRARVIAQTETIQAYQQSSTNETERASEELDIEIQMRWLTRLDNRVRHLHASWHGTLATPEENRVRIGKSPYNCRCGNSPVIPIANTQAKKEKFAKEREQLLKLERQ